MARDNGAIRLAMVAVSMMLLGGCGAKAPAGELALIDGKQGQPAPGKGLRVTNLTLQKPHAAGSAYVTLAMDIAAAPGTAFPGDLNVDVILLDTERNVVGQNGTGKLTLNPDGSRHAVIEPGFAGFGCHAPTQVPGCPASTSEPRCPPPLLPRQAILLTWGGGRQQQIELPEWTALPAGPPQECGA
ncbi:hypothetical protein [Novosphingobium lentum]|uniref:hypothetical protein n=1 Tax=Novosphingobium lentum TaxID=145287 RepID=UPI0008305102|nr:hypothetical protein [Novosphingobium lentum]